MMSFSADILVATCTATLDLHSSSSTTSSYSYFAFASALRSRTARSAELRPPIPLTETPPVSGPMKPTLILSFASAGTTATNHTAARMAVATFNALVIRSSLVQQHGGNHTTYFNRDFLLTWKPAAIVHLYYPPDGHFELSSV